MDTRGVVKIAAIDGVSTGMFAVGTREAVLIAVTRGGALMTAIGEAGLIISLGGTTTITIIRESGLISSTGGAGTRIGGAEGTGIGSITGSGTGAISSDTNNVEGVDPIPAIVSNPAANKVQAELPFDICSST